MIEDWEAYKASLWDWSCLDGCFGDTKIKPTDIDGFVERNGHFLVIETKLPGVEIKTGQMIMFSRLVTDHRFTVLFVWGHPGFPESIEVWKDDKKKTIDNADLDRFRLAVSNWFEYADRTNGFY